MNTTRHRRIAGLAATGLCLVSLTACRPAGTAATTSGDTVAAASSTGSSSVAAASPAAPVATGSGGAGSITLALTAPKAVSGHVNTTVSCTTGRLYHAASTAVVQGYTVHVAASARGFVGPGTYPTTLAGSIVAPDGEAFAFAAVPTTGQLSTTGGSTSLSLTGSRGHTLAGSLSWACS